jgi:hypothetical protein
LINECVVVATGGRIIGLMNKKPWLALLFSLVLIAALLSLICTSNAKTGYSLNVKVDDSTWSWSQSSQTLSFRTESEVEGDGRSSKYASLSGFAGNSIKENTYTNNGSLSAKSTMMVKSLVNYIHITEQVDDSSNSYHAEINESLPTTVFSEDDIFYKGKGIYSRNNYRSNDININTDYQGSKLLKTVRYAGTYSNSYIWADVTPSWVCTRELSNNTAAIKIYSISDRYSGFSVDSGDKLLEDNYQGVFTINRNLLYKNKFYLNQSQYPLGDCGI